MTTLVIHKSHLRAGRVVLRDGAGLTLHSHDSAWHAIQYCRRNGYKYTFPLPTFEALIAKEEA